MPANFRLIIISGNVPRFFPFALLSAALKTKMTTELLNDDNIVRVGGEEPKYSDKNLSQCYFVHHKYHKD